MSGGRAFQSRTVLGEKRHFPFVDPTAWNLVGYVVRMPGFSSGLYNSVIFTDGYQGFVYFVEHTKPGILPLVL